MWSLAWNPSLFLVILFVDSFVAKIGFAGYHSHSCFKSHPHPLGQNIMGSANFLCQHSDVQGRSDCHSK